jgi:hypothetical protein
MDTNASKSWRLFLALMLIIPTLATSLPSLSAQSSKIIDLQIIVDQSGSMAAATDTGPLRIDAAKTVLNEVIAQIPEEQGINVGLRVYGHRGNNKPDGQAESCVSSDLLVPMQGVDKTTLTAQVNALQPVGWTPIGYALEQAANDFTEPASENVVNAIILVTDGLETCGADPAEIAGELKSLPAGITTHVIGFGTKPEELAILQAITQASGGLLLDSNNAGQLMSSLFTILEDLEVVEVSGTGVDRTSPIALGRTGVVGDYEITVLNAQPANLPTGTTGGYDFVVRVSVTYIGQREGTPSQDLRFTASGELEITYTYPHDACASQPGNFETSGSLFQGGSAEFHICWLVAANDVESLMMTATSSQGDGAGRVWFALNRNTPISATTDAQAPLVIEIVVDDTLRITPDTITIPANTDVVIAAYNPGFLEHNIAIPELGIEGTNAANGEYSEITVNLPAGIYTIECMVPGHSAAGEVAALIVE